MPAAWPQCDLQLNWGSVWWGWIFVLVGVPPLWGREIPADDTLGPCLCLPQSPDSARNPKVQSEYHLHASLFTVSDPSGSARRGNVVLSHSFKCQFREERGHGLVFSGSFLHRLGLQYFFNDLVRVSTDENTLRIHLERNLAGPAGIGLDSDISTALLNNYDILWPDSGKIRRILKSAFLTPMVWNLTAGLNLGLGTTVSVLLGLSGARLTLVRNAGVYEALGVPVFFGVPSGKHTRLEYGLSLKFLMDKTFRNFFRWNADLLLFKNFAIPWDLNLKNSFEFRVSDYFVFTVQTKIVYDCDISRKVLWENLVSGGFSVRF